MDSKDSQPNKNTQYTGAEAVKELEQNQSSDDTTEDREPTLAADVTQDKNRMEEQPERLDESVDNDTDNLHPDEHKTKVVMVDMSSMMPQEGYGSAFTVENNVYVSTSYNLTEHFNHIDFQIILRDGTKQTVTSSENICVVKCKSKDICIYYIPKLFMRSLPRGPSIVHIKSGKITHRKSGVLLDGNTILTSTEVSDSSPCEIIFSDCSKTSDVKVNRDESGCSHILLKQACSDYTVEQWRQSMLAGLRQLLPKPAKKSAKTNAEKCRDYKERIRSSPRKHQLMLEKQRSQCHAWRQRQTPEKKERARELARLRQQKRRDRLRLEQKGPNKTPATTTTPTRSTTRKQTNKDIEKREKARQRQAKRRASIRANPQRYRREKEKRRERYLTSKPKPSAGQKDHNKKLFSLVKVLKGIKDTLAKGRTKLSLARLDFIKKILARQDPHQSAFSFYKRPPRQACLIDAYYNKVSVDIPYQKGGSKPKKVLTKRLVDVYREFKKEYPSSKVSFTTFKRRRPGNILLAGGRKFVQCLCERCVNAMLMMDAVNVYLRKKSDDCELVGMRDKITYVEELVDKTLCGTVTRECMERNCSRCGVECLMGQVRAEVGDRILEVIEWKRWEKTDNRSRDLVNKSGTVETLLVCLTSDLQSLSKHVKVAQWQRKQYQSFHDNLPVGHAMCTADFAENYLCKFQQEVQSAHWSYRQVSVHPCVFFYRCPVPECRTAVTDYRVFISADLKHDAAISNLIFEKCLQYAESKGILALQIFSDGCSSQYKSRLPFFQLSELQTVHPSVKIARHFFGSSHGKSLCDSSGGTVKNCATRAVANGHYIIQSAKDLYDFCNSELIISVPDDETCQHTVRSFVLVESSDIDRTLSTEQVSAVKGTRDIHCLSPSGSSGILKARSLSCFCSVCLLGEEGTCDNEPFTLPWRSVCVKKIKQG